MCGSGALTVLWHNHTFKYSSFTFIHRLVPTDCSSLGIHYETDDIGDTKGFVDYIIYKHRKGRSHLFRFLGREVEEAAAVRTRVEAVFFAVDLRDRPAFVAVNEVSKET